MHKKIYIAIITVLVLGSIILFELLLGRNSISEQRRVAQENAQFQQEIDSLNNVIKLQEEEIERILNDSLYKETILRTRYGMSRKDEKAFQMVNQK